MTYDNPLAGVSTGVYGVMIEYTDLRELVEYNPIEGCFTWKKSHGFKKAGKVLSASRITLLAKTYTPGKLAWFYTFGRWPGKHFSYCDGDKLNIKLSNLNNERIYQRKPARPSSRTTVTIEKVEDGFHLTHTIGNVSNDMGTYSDYTVATDVQRWLLCSGSTQTK